jgi:hypothetical protein
MIGNRGVSRYFVTVLVVHVLIASTLGACGLDESESDSGGLRGVTEQSEPDPAPDVDPCSPAALEDLLQEVTEKEWTSRPDEIAFGAFVLESDCRVVVQSDSFLLEEEQSLLELDPDGRILVERTAGPVERREGG